MGGASREVFSLEMIKSLYFMGIYAEKPLAFCFLRGVFS